jgi:AmmeMemoRadiSam system protein A
VEYSHPLADDEKRELLRIARATLREYLFSGRIPPGKPHREALCAPAGVFISLYHGDTLRGRQGIVAATKPLYRAIQEMAVAATVADSRFTLVRELPLAEIIIETAVLGESRPVTRPDDINVGEEGLWIEIDGAQTILLLPVAGGGDSQTWLGHRCGKASLDDEVWRNPAATLRAFRAQVFSDITHPKLVDPTGYS